MPATGTGRTPHAEWGRGGDTAQAGLTGHAHAGRARRRGGRPRRQRALAFVAGIFFAADLTFFHHAIVYLGAGLATVMGNLQVIFVGFIGWLLLGERPANRLVTAVPVALTGGVLLSGVIGRGACGSDPGLGVILGLLTAASYAGYLLVLRRGQDGRHVAGPILDATVATAIFSALGGLVVGDLGPLPRWASGGWPLPPAPRAAARAASTSAAGSAWPAGYTAGAISGSSSSSTCATATASPRWSWTRRRHRTRTPPPPPCAPSASCASKARWPPGGRARRTRSWPPARAEWG